MIRSRISSKLVFSLAAGLLATSCFAAKPAPAKDYIFFPPPPDEAHIQFLTSFNTDEEFSELEGKRNFFRFIVGKDKVVKAIMKPYGIAASPGRMFVCDTGAATVQIADLAKKKLSFWNPTGDGTLGMPVNVAIDSDGTRYITDVKRDQVLVYKEDAYVAGIGKRGEMKPTGVALYKNRIYVTDIQNACVRVYDKASRQQLFTFPKAQPAGAVPADPANKAQPSAAANVKPANEPAKLFGPTNLAIDPQGHVYVCDTRGFQVFVYDSEGKYLRTIGKMGLSPGTFSLPKGVAVDRESRCYVVDANTQLVQLFDKDGQVLMYFGDPSSNGGGSMSLPAGISVDYDNAKYFQSFAAPNFQVEYLVLVTNQAGGRRVSVFGFGHKK